MCGGSWSTVAAAVLLAPCSPAAHAPPAPLPLPLPPPRPRSPPPSSTILVPCRRLSATHRSTARRRPDTVRNPTTYRPERGAGVDRGDHRGENQRNLCQPRRSAASSVHHSWTMRRLRLFNVSPLPAGDRQPADRRAAARTRRDGCRGQPQGQGQAAKGRIEQPSKQEAVAAHLEGAATWGFLFNQGLATGLAPRILEHGGLTHGLF